jgi:hypothetical protein
MCRGAYIYVTKGPGYLYVFFCIGAKLLAGMADLIKKGDFFLET